MDMGLRWGKSGSLGSLRDRVARLSMRARFYSSAAQGQDKLAVMGRNIATMAGRDGSDGEDHRKYSVLRGNPLPMWIYDRETLRFLEVSAGAVREYGYSREEFATMTVDALRPRAGSEPDAIPECCENVDGGSKGWKLVTHVRKDGSQVFVEISSNALVYDGQVARLVVARDMGDRLTLCAELTQLTLHDRGTGIANPKRLLLRAREAFEHADKTQRRVAVVRMELDQIEQVSEQFGQAARDSCLQQVATWLTRRVRGMDTVARTGDREFTLILAELDDDFDLYRVATALLKVFAKPALVEG